MSDLGISPKTVSWCRVFLENRGFGVRVNGVRSPPLAALSGVPQGSCTAPLFYTLFLLDLGAYIPSGVEYLVFADDLKVYRPITSDSSRLLLQEAVAGVIRWCSENGMIISTQKCMVLKSSPDETRYYIDGSPIPDTQYVRDLRVTLSTNLDFGLHCLCEVLFHTRQCRLQSLCHQRSQLQYRSV